MKILCITHADFESPGVIESWASMNGHSFEVIKPYAGEQLKNDNFDMLVIMGGPQSPLKADEFPYLNDEIDLIKSALKQDKHVLGFCLGAQLIGEALGARTERSPEKEVGVFPLTLTEAGQQDPLLKNFATPFLVIHWHNDMPGLTKNSVLLAHSAGCPRQIIRYEPKVYGFQCHLEITQEGMRGMLEAVPSDLKPSKYTQNKDEIMNHDYTEINDSMKTILDRFVEL